jgi:hypothetical protein
MKSIFEDQKIVPTNELLEAAIGETFLLWTAIENYTLSLCPEAKKEWKFSGQKHGWSYRISDKKRVLVYLLPRDKFFKVAFVFGKIAFHEIVESHIDVNIKNELMTTKEYAEGRGIRIVVTDENQLKDIQFLIETKINN